MEASCQPESDETAWDVHYETNMMGQITGYAVYRVHDQEPVKHWLTGW